LPGPAGFSLASGLRLAAQNENTMADSFTKSVRRGDRGKNVRLAQEWLTFHGFATVIDGIFGPATELATKTFQSANGLAASGVVNAPTQKAMLSAIEAVQQPIPAGGTSLDDLYIAYARRHLEQHPVEVGGQNRGPWVRLYMNGNEGPEWPWCAGFATWVLRQASRAKGETPPHAYGFSCDVLALKGREKGRFVSVRQPADFPLVQPGCLFLVRRAQNDWNHIGIVESIIGEAMTTIEGNTNDQNSVDGFEVCRRTRSLAGKDYLIV
jgi:hypothetical protein